MIQITEINLKAPCSMPLCHSLAKYSIHDIPGREQTGIVICEDCLRGIVDAFMKTVAAKVVVNQEKEAATPVEDGVDGCQVAAVQEKKKTAKKKAVTKE